MWRENNIDIVECVKCGHQMREADNHVRKWDLDRMRQPQGQQYRTYGPRSGPIV